MIIDCHTHSFFSDGELLPSELIRRCIINGYNVLAITDHADTGNIKSLLSKTIPAIEHARKYTDMKIFAGVEITHVHPNNIADCVKLARDSGASIVVVHGETPVENVFEGTNEAAINAGCDILAHPGRISERLAALARDKNVLLEVSSRRGSCYSNGHIVKVARDAGTPLILNSDAHAPADILTEYLYNEVALGAGMTEKEIENMQVNLLKWVETIRF